MPAALEASSAGPELAHPRWMHTVGSVLSRFLLYGAAGWTLEVFFTGVCSVLGKDRAATAKTYLWMHPIYGGAALGLEQLEVLMKRRRIPFAARAAVHTLGIYGVEYSTGALLRRAVGRCPWDYGESGGRHLNGLVRLDYAPLWYGVAALFTLARPLLHRMVAPRKSRWALLREAVSPKPEEEATAASLGALRLLGTAARAALR